MPTQAKDGDLHRIEAFDQVVPVYRHTDAMHALQEVEDPMHG